MGRRSLWIGLLVLLVTLGVGTVAHAHATLRQALPEPDVTLEKAPDQVALQFSEEVEAEFGALSVYDHTGARVDKGDGALDPHDPTRLVATLKELGDGLYTVSYRVISVDGHPISGSYGFTVGRGVEGASYYQPAVGESADGRPPAGVVAGFWLGVVGLISLTGLTLFQGLVLRTPGSTALVRWLWAAWAAAVAGWAVLLVARTAQAAGVSVGSVLGSPGLMWRLLLTRTGLALLGRLAVLVVAPLLIGAAARRWWPAALAGALGLLTVSLGGHAVALQRPPVTVGLDWLHLLAASAWAGGLLQFAFLVRSDLGAVVRRFSPVAAVSVAVLAGSGLYPALLHIPSQKALLQTTYGLALLVKLGLVAGLLLLGAANMLLVGPALRRGVEAADKLRWLATAEVALMAGVLGVTALLTNVAPARAALPPEKLNVGIHTQGYEMLWEMAPLAPGYRTMTVQVRPHAGELTADTNVQLELIHKEHEMGRNVSQGRLTEPGVYKFEQVLVGMAGEWAFLVTVERPGYPPETARYDVTVPEAP